MDKNAIKKFAVWARTELIARVSLKGVEYGITEDNIVDAAADSINGKVLTDAEKKQRQALIAEINDKGYKQVMEEVAYTWFNRFSALRFMEVNGYLPSHVRVFTDEENNFKPQIITEAIHLELDSLDMEKVYELKEAEKTEELYKYLLIVQCNALNKILPGMFQKISDYTELLLPDNLLRDGSVIQQMIELIPEDDWKDAVQIIGWLYQYYNVELKNQVFSRPKGKKIEKEDIPAATQLFTPDWIVRYMVENSLGRLWLEGHPDAKNRLLPTEGEHSAYVAGNRDQEDGKWHYYLEEAEQEPEVQAQLAEIRKEYAALTPEQLKVIDPCSGSGHILAYMFDVLMKIYESYGYTTREAVASIVENNIYGLDIDDRAAQLAYFAVMMKARQYDRRFFNRGIQPHVYAIVESNHVDEFAVEYFCSGDAKLKEAMDTIISELHDAKEYGSILTVTQQDWSALYDRFAEITEDINMSRDVALAELLPLVQVAECLAQKYDTVCTNPPYMGNKGMNETLSAYLQSNYPHTKYDLFAVFIEKGLNLTKEHCNLAMITQNSWMAGSRYENARNDFLRNSIQNLVHLGTRAFDEIGGEVVQTVAFCFGKSLPTSQKGKYVKLTEIAGEKEKEEAFHNPNNVFVQSVDTFLKMPSFIVGYWISNNVLECLQKEKPIEDGIFFRQGMATSDNNRFLRHWPEVNLNRIGFGIKSREEAQESKLRWFPYNKGGSYRKWFGNNDLVVNWENDGAEMKAFTSTLPQGTDVRLKSKEYYFKEGFTWSALANSVSVRYCPAGFIFDTKGSMGFPYRNELIKYFTGLINSSSAELFLEVLAPTLDFNLVSMKQIPMIVDRVDEVTRLVDECVELSATDWDSFEVSWNFKKHPLISGRYTLLKDAFDIWETSRKEAFDKLKENEEQLNKIFAEIYGLENEVDCCVKPENVTIRLADKARDVRSLISYAVGCMFGRYSLDVNGIVYAGGEWDYSKYVSFPVDKDNIIPICDDEYFEDDIVGLFVEFVKTVYGAETLDENLKFIADALGGKGQPKEVIRNYFLNEFYFDHCNNYQTSATGKRPIYWLFDSGKKNGFKALIYMHRYHPDTIARIRTDYVHEQQARYRTAIADLEQRIANASTSERVKLNRKLTNLQAQDAEIRIYEEKIHHLADQMISIDLDDGVKKNYAIFQDVLAKIK